MPSQDVKVQILRDVPTAELEEILKGLAKQKDKFEWDAPEQQSDGLWTLTIRPRRAIVPGDRSFSFVAETVGEDIVVRDVTATWFGGPDDPSDSGRTASGVSTRDDPDLLGCALPMNGFGNPKTDGSPIPRLAWKTPVKVRNLRTGLERTFPLIDLGPSKFAASHAAIDLTKAAFIALGENPGSGKMRVDYLIPGGAHHHVSATESGGSLSQFERPNLSGLGGPGAGHGMSHDVLKPIVSFIESPNFSSRNGSKIDMIVMHYTAGSSAQGAINRFLNPREQVSAHYIIERDGTIYQMVRDSDKAWHAKSANPRSIGIEHVALPEQGMTALQELSSIGLVKWLMATYNIKKKNITGHRFAPGNEGTTDCPDHLFGTPTKTAIMDWVDKHFSQEQA